MFECEICGREFKGKSGLTNHRKACELVVTEEHPITLEEETDVVNAIATYTGESTINVVKKIAEIKEENTELFEGASNEVDKGQELSDNIRRKLDKLRDARSSTWDAQARYEIDMQIARLKRASNV